MEHVLILDAAGKLVVSRLDPGCRAQCFDQASPTVETCRIHGAGTRRRCKLQAPAGTVFLCTDDQDLINSKRQFQSRIASYVEMLGAFSDLRDDTIKRLQVENRRLVHNLTTLNSHILQEIYDIIPQEQLTGDAHIQIASIKQALVSDPERAASGALRILKNAVAARAEMQIVRWLQPSDSPPGLNPKSHVLHKVVTNTLITFYQDSQEQRLVWLLGPSKTKVLFDYQTVSAAMYRLFENAIKYCKPATAIRVSFPVGASGVEMCIEMTSLRISSDEKEEIFSEGYSGKVARASKLHGDGLGLHFVREMLKLNGAKIRCEPSAEDKLAPDEKYAVNRFVITFPPGSASSAAIKDVTPVLSKVAVSRRPG